MDEACQAYYSPSEPMSSKKIIEDVQQLEQKLATVRARADDEQSAFDELEDQVQALGAKLALTRLEVSDLEGVLAEKQAELAEAEYDDALQAREEAAARLADAVSQVLAELDVHDRTQQAIAALRGGSEALDAEPEVATESLERLVNAVQQRITKQYEDELVEAASRSLEPGAIQELPAHLREAARELTRSRRRNHSSR